MESFVCEDKDDANLLMNKLRSSSSHIFTIPESTIFCFHQIFFALFFYKVEVFYWDQKCQYNWLSRAWVSTGAKGAWHPWNFWTVMSGTRWCWQFYYIMLCCTLRFWGFTSDWHPLFQIPNSNPVIITEKDTLQLFKKMKK